MAARKNIWFGDNEAYLLDYLALAPGSLSGRIISILDRYRGLMKGINAIAKKFTADEQQKLRSAYDAWPQLFATADALLLDLPAAFSARTNDKALAGKLKELTPLERIQLAEWLDHNKKAAD